MCSALRQSRGDKCLMCFPKQLAKFAMLILLALLLLCYGFGKVHCATIHENSVDLHSLLDFKMGIDNDPYRALRNWNISTHFCRWNGVKCTLARPWRVLELNLTHQSLAGQLTSSLGNLTFLKKLDLSQNNLRGPLPPLNQLEQLEILCLNNNLLHGTIPGLLTNSSGLTKLELSANLLEGAIPPNIGFGSSLISLGLSQNNLSGNIPPTLGNITTLNDLYLDVNRLSGGIPDKIWQLPKLIELLLSENNLSGRIPQTLSNISSLHILALENNQLEKEWPPNIGNVLRNLQSLTVDNNRFEGRIPPSLANVSRLELLDLSRNSFSGQVPALFGNLTHLSILNLEYNNLEASDNQSWLFIDALRNCSNLQVLSVAYNQLKGYIPDSIGSLSTNLYRLFLGSNNLSGIVPVSIGNLHGLVSLGLDHNNLTGTIEEWVGNLKNLQGLYLERNQLNGSIPSSIGNLENLVDLLLSGNIFEDIIPPSLGNLSMLLHLDLSYNSLQGSIPLEVTNLKQLITLDLSANYLTGEIPNHLDNCKNLVNIQMDQNFLIGHIPESLGNLDSLNTLDLSHNNLSGTIPPKLSDLALLHLDLSYNHLQGEVPRNGVFANATAVSLYGNSGLCGGTSDLRMPPCSTVPRRMDRRFYLIRVLIPIFGFMSLALLIYFLLLEKSSRTKYLPLPPFGKQFRKVSYNDLAQATRNFSESNLIGRGSYGRVYRGKLKEHKMEVAVKVFDLEMQGAERSFLSECEAVRSIQHRNLLSILTACSTVDNAGNVFKALVYEFMPNGNLDTWLHQKEGGKAPKHLGIAQRIAIAVNIADALDYMHHDCGRPTIHCDLKPSNILLDDDMNAILGDFGIARFYSGSWSALTGSTGVKGTIGYIAPEYGQGGHASTSGDAYSFGIVLLEMMTGKRPTDPMFNDGLNIIKFVDSNFPHQLCEAIDARLLQECRKSDEVNIEPENAVYQCLVSLLQVALSCTHPLPSERMNMKESSSKIHAIQASYVLASKAKE